MNTHNTINQTTVKGYFNLCLDIPDYKTEDLKDEFLNPDDDKYNFDDFSRLLIKTKLEEYTELLYDFFLLSDERNIDMIKYKKRKRFWLFSSELLENILVPKDYDKGHYDALRFLIINEDDGIDVFLKNKKYNNNIKISSNFFSDFIKKSLLEYLDPKRILEYEEAYEEIKKLEDFRWIQKHLRIKHFDNLLFNPKFRTFDEIKDFIDDELIYLYAEEHTSKSKATLEEIEDILKDLENYSKKRVGAKRKNDEITELSLQLIYLINIKDFLSQNTVNDISNLTITNKDCDLVYQILLFFDRINKIEPFTKTKPHNLIRSYISNYKKTKIRETDNPVLEIEDRINTYYQNNNKIISAE